MLLINASVFLAGTRFPVLRAGQTHQQKCLWGTNVSMCVRESVLGGWGGETALVGGVNPTHYNSSLWPFSGKGLQGPTAASYQYVFLFLHLCKRPLTTLACLAVLVAIWSFVEINHNSSITSAKIQIETFFAAYLWWSRWKDTSKVE